MYKKQKYYYFISYYSPSPAWEVLSPDHLSGFREVLHRSPLVNLGNTTCREVCQLRNKFIESNRRELSSEANALSRNLLVKFSSQRTVSPVPKERPVCIWPHNYFQPSWSASNKITRLSHTSIPSYRNHDFD